MRPLLALAVLTGCVTTLTVTGCVTAPRSDPVRVTATRSHPVLYTIRLASGQEKERRLIEIPANQEVEITLKTEGHLLGVSYLPTGLQMIGDNISGQLPPGIYGFSINVLDKALTTDEVSWFIDAKSGLDKIRVIEPE